MITTRIVTEKDFRSPEFIDAVVDDYEFRDDGKLVRKDRWENGLRAIASLVGFSGRNTYEIQDVIARVKSRLED